jgi:hypothetical protein
MSEYRDTAHVVTHKVDIAFFTALAVAFTSVGFVLGTTWCSLVDKQPSLIDKQPTVIAYPSAQITTLSVPIKPNLDLCDIVFTGNATHKRTILNDFPAPTCEQARIDATTLYGPPEGVITIEPHKD